jgi:hypothetical protein
MQGQKESLTLLDYMGISVIAVQLIFQLFAWPIFIAPQFAAMFKDFGATIP